MPRSKIVVIGEEDAVFGLGLLGFEGRAVMNLEQARQAVKEAAADPETSLILLTESWAEAQPGLVDEAGALVVEIPGPIATNRPSSLEERIKRALGVHLEA
jgi:vacuolar-type H+-ATPase subunit F/Vma7